MTTLTEATPNVEFIMMEGQLSYSRENGEVASGQNLAAGTVVQYDGGSRFIAYTGDEFTNGEEDEAQGILLYATNASAGHVKAAVLVRHAVVNLNLLTFPAAKQASMVQSLKRLGIICR